MRAIGRWLAVTMFITVLLLATPAVQAGAYDLPSTPFEGYQRSQNIYCWAHDGGPDYGFYLECSAGPRAWAFFTLSDAKDYSGEGYYDWRIGRDSLVVTEIPATPWGEGQLVMAFYIPHYPFPDNTTGPDDPNTGPQLP